jgi:hypothetical protein
MNLSDHQLHPLMADLSANKQCSVVAMAISESILVDSDQQAICENEPSIVSEKDELDFAGHGNP